MNVGKVAGCLFANGYLYTSVDGRQYLNHQIVWLWHHGFIPECQIDHIDRNKLNNRIENLREATQTCNTRNTGSPCTNTSGVKGVGKSGNKWCSQIVVAGKQIWLGSHSTFIEAVCHRLAAEQALGWAGCDSASPAYQYVKNNINKRENVNKNIEIEVPPC